jgi:chromosome partitioning protein
MKIIAVMALKGGVGKTTIAVHLATAAAANGAAGAVALLDTDPQRSATRWSEARGDKAPKARSIGPAEIRAALRRLEAEGCALAIVDTAPAHSAAATEIARAADLVLVPCRPGPLDLAAATTSARVLGAAGTPGAFVLNACPYRAPEIPVAREVLGALGRLAPVELADRRIYSRAVATGNSVGEAEPEGKAAAEIAALWSWIKGEFRI